MQKEIKKLTRQVKDKQQHIEKLEKQDKESHASACLDTKQIEKQIFELSKDLEVNRERLKNVDKEIFDISGQEIEHTDDEEEENDVARSNVISDVMSQSLFGSHEMLSQGDGKGDMMSKSMNENMLLRNVESGKRLEFTSTPIRMGFDMNKEISDLLNTKGHRLKEAEKTSKKLQFFKRSNENVSDPLLRLKYDLNTDVPPAKPARHIPVESKDSKAELNLSLEEDNFIVNPTTSPKRVASQDDIDRISKITNDSPLVSTQGASDKVKESIKEIEKNRQILLAQQGSHLIEYEKRKVQELKKRSQDEAKAKYMEQQQKWTNSLPKNVNITRSPKPMRHEIPYLQYQQQQSERSNDRPLSEVNSECSFEGNYTQEMSFFVAQNHSTPQSRIHQQHQQGKPESPDVGAISLNSENRNSIQSENSSEGAVVRRNIAKHQRPLTRYLPIFTELNLREHIESAGHQIGLCPHVILDRTTCKG